MTVVWPTPIIEVDFTNPANSSTDTWTDITKYCRTLGGVGAQLMHCERGRNYERAQTDAGVLTLVLDNTDGRFDPSNATSPYASLGQGVTPMRKIRVRWTWSATTYSVWRGFVEDWPRSWRSSGFYGAATVTARGAFAALALVSCTAQPVATAQADSPRALYRLNDASGSAVAGNSSAFQQPYGAVVYGSTIIGSGALVSAANFTFGGTSGSGNLAADPSGSLTLTPSVYGSGVDDNGNPEGYALQTQANGSGASLVSTGNWTVECWLQSTANGTGPTGGTSINNSNSQVFELLDRSGTQLAQIYFNALTNNYTVGGSVSSNGVAVAGVNNFSAPPVTDGKWHHLALRLAADGKTATVFIDGVSIGGSTAAGALTWGTPTSMYWGGSFATGHANGRFFLNGSLKNLAVYNTALTDPQILAHYQAGSGPTGEHTGTRIGRILDQVPYPTGATYRNLATGDSTVGPYPLDGTGVTAALQALNDTEQGVVFEDGQGRIAFTNRLARGSTASVATFSESANHYEGDLQITQDPKELYTSVRVERQGGVKVTAVDTTATAKFFPRTLTSTSVNDTDAQAVDLSTYLLYRYDVPRDRIAQVTIIPSANTSLWPQALGREIGDRITVGRSTGPAPANTADYYIEKITHDVSVGEWKTTFMLSPASLFDYWTVEDNTYGYIEAVGPNVSYPIEA